MEHSHHIRRQKGGVHQDQGGVNAAHIRLLGLGSSLQLHWGFDDVHRAACRTFLNSAYRLDYSLGMERLKARVDVLQVVFSGGQWHAMIPALRFLGSRFLIVPSLARSVHSVDVVKVPRVEFYL